MTHIKSLGYLRVQSSDLARWRELTIDALGFGVGSGPDPDGLYLRVDERRSRLAVLPGDTDKVLAVGWEVRDQYALDAVKRDVEAAGRGVKTLTVEECAELDVEQAIAFEDPSGTRVEVYFGPVLDHSPVLTRWGQRFHTGAEGLGHVVLPTPHQQETVDFYCEVLGFLPRGAMKIHEGPSRIRFLGINRRHHSLAVCPAPNEQPPGMIHLMVEVDTLDAVGQALDEVRRREFSISSTLGRHTNDKMISFYVRAPGGWDIEYGCEGMLVNETSYTAEEITADSYWGHDWSGSEPLAAFAPRS
ncbi:2,3-dihydroxybiphenyl 1,2-dioxygenase [Nocardioides sp. BGMRC 2183]|nr:2,3-dihydroxybiphenyl 1,2-dioxygenase [Nocardioides sp. BGMRC 2183]